jgi:hypothetical protein
MEALCAFAEGQTLPFVSTRHSKTKRENGIGQVGTLSFDFTFNLQARAVSDKA